MKHDLWGKACAKERRKMVEREVRRKEEERRCVKAVRQAQESAWTRWEGVQVRTLKWQDIWRMEPILLNFLLQAMYDVLPLPATLIVSGGEQFLVWRSGNNAACTECMLSSIGSRKI